MSKMNNLKITLFIMMISISLLTMGIASTINPNHESKNIVEKSSEILIDAEKPVLSVIPEPDPAYLAVESIDIELNKNNSTSITISNVTDLAAFQFTLSWDSSVISVLEVNSSDGSFGSVNSHFDQNLGLLNVTWFDVGGVSGDLLYVVNVTFEPNITAIDGDWCFLNLSNSILANTESEPLSYIIQNGSATITDINGEDNIILSVGSADIPFNGNSTVSVNAYGATNLAAFQMNITYNESIVSVIKVDDSNGVFAYGNVNYYNHESIGILSVNSFNTSGFSGDLLLFNITFEPAAGAIPGDISSLCITDTVLGNVNTDPLDFITQNGTLTIQSVCSEEINGIKFNDINENGTQDCDEGGIENWTINLYQAVSCVDEPVVWADEVVVYVNGTQKDGDPIDETRTYPERALGPAVDEDDDNYVSLGYNGSGYIILQFTDNLIVNGVGDDIEVIETTFGSQNCTTYPEKIDVYVSQKNTDDWDYLGRGCLDSRFDLSNGTNNYDWVQYVKIIDASNDSSFSDDSDGFDVNGVKALNTLCWEHNETTTTDATGYYEFSNLCDGIYKIVEETKTGWINITPTEKILIIDGTSENVDFGNKQIEDPDEPELSVSKSVKIDCCPPYQDDGVFVGLEDPRWVTFNITVEGNGVFSSVIVTDDLPYGLDTDDDLIWDFGSQSDDWSQTITFTAEIIEDFCGNITNQVNVTGLYGCDEELIVTDTAWVNIECDEPDEEIIVVEKQVKPDCDVCDYSSNISFDITNDVDFVTYKVDVTLDDLNETFTEPIYNLSIKDNLPQLDGLRYNDSFIKTEIGSYFEDYIITLTEKYIYWNFTKTVIPGQTFSLYYCADVIGCGEFENMVNVTALYYNGGPCCPVDLFANDTAVVDVICGPGIEVTKEASLNGITWEDNLIESFVDDTVWFRLTIENTGYETLEGVNVYDYLPVFLEFKEMIDDGDADVINTTCENQSYDLRWFFTNIEIDEVIEIVFTVDVTDVGTADNLVTVHDCPDIGEPGVGDSDTVTVVVEEGLHVDKKVYDETTDSWVENVSAESGDTIEWNIAVSFYSSNHTNILHHILVNDTLPEELSYVNNSAKVILSNGSSYMMNPMIDDTQLIWDLNEEFLLSGDWLSITFETIVDTDDTGLLENLVDVTGKVCNGTSYDSSDAATVYLIETMNAAPTITSWSPENNAVDVDVDAVLEVSVDDAENDTLTVVFMNASDDMVIAEITSIRPPDTVDATWENLEYNTSYEWYVTVSDENHTITSDMWSFTTSEEPTNQPPAAPKNPNPNDNAGGVSLNPVLSVHVSDPDGDSLSVQFFDADTDLVIGSDTCTSDCTASISWNGLTFATSYEWYVVVSDDEFNVTSETWSFTTKDPDVDLDVEITGGIGVNAEIINLGSDDAHDVSWSIHVVNKGLFTRINKSDSGMIDTIEGSGDVVAKKLSVFGVGRITITVIADCDLIDETVVETKDALLLGPMVFIKE